jgi:ABC-2 type transport system permease protein
MRAVYGIVVRELMRFLRQRARLVSSVARPFVWLIFAGAGFATVFTGGGAIDYRRYMTPGLIGMVVMFGALLASLSTVTDRDAGVLRMVLVAPIRRSTVALGKALGATLLGTAQALVVGAILVPLVGLAPSPAGVGLALVAVVLTSLALGALGLVLAASIRSLENFAGVMNFVVFPMLFLSGALYPLRRLGPALQILAHANPLAYGVDLLKHALLADWAGVGFGGELAIALDIGALALSAGLCLSVAAPLLAREGGVTRTAFRGAGGREGGGGAR